MQAIYQTSERRALRVMQCRDRRIDTKDLDRWAYWNKVELDFNRLGKPSDNALVEALNSRFRQECLNQHWFMSLEDAEAKVSSWQQEYNTERPHSALGYRSPIQSEPDLTNEDAVAA